MIEGPDQLVAHVLARLEQGLPLELARLRTDRGLTVDDLPDPATILSYQPESEGLDELPAVYVTELETTMQATGTTDDQGTIMLADTEVAVYGFVSGWDQASTSRCRQLYTVAIRKTLLRNPHLGDGVRVVRSNIRESHYEVDRGDQTLAAGVRTRIHVKSDEIIGPALPPLGWPGQPLTVTHTINVIE